MRQQQRPEHHRSSRCCYLRVRHTFDRSKARSTSDGFPATARTANAGEKSRLWPLMADRYPFDNGYLTATERDIPLVVLDRTDRLFRSKS